MKKIIIGVVAIILVAGIALFAKNQIEKSGDCCNEGSSCCHSGSACCVK